MKMFIGANANLQGKAFERNKKDVIQQYTETLKAIADYVWQEYTHGGDIWSTIEILEDSNRVRHADPTEGASQYDIES